MTSSERNPHSFCLAVMLALLCLSLSTCGRDNPMRSSGAADVVVAPAKAVLTAPGRTVRLTATVRDQAGQPVTGAEVRWSSGSPSVATVDQSGLVTARQAGTAVITAASGSAAGQATVTVEPLKPKTVAVTPATATLTAPGQTVRLTATARDQAGQPVTDADVRWSSGSPSVATVDQSGLVTARQPGTAVITAASGGTTGQATVTVGDSAPRAMSIAPRITTLKYWKQTVQLTVTAYDGNGEPVEAPSIVWSSGNENVATVDESGLVTAGQIGTTWITAALDGSTLQAKVTVIQPVTVDRIDLVITGVAGMMPGDTRRIDPVALNNDGGALRNPAPTFTWSSDNPSVATVDQSGLVTAHAHGTAVITAAVDYGTGVAKATETIYVTNPDRDILIDLYHGTDGPNWTNRAGWLTDAPLSEWHGVTVDGDIRVTGLNLSNNRLSGPLPAAELSRLDRLRHVDFHSNLLTGSIPAEFDYPDQLQDLDFSDNRLSGPIPPELGRLTNLTYLGLYDNDLSGPIPPELGDMDQLIHLKLNGNPLSGYVPLALIRLRYLKSLHIDGTRTCIPPDAGIQAWLQGLQDKRLPGPCINTDREALVAFYHAMNGPGWKINSGWLSDAPLGEWQGVTTDEYGRVTALEFWQENLSGRIPSELGSLDMLQRLKLNRDNSNDQAFRGPIPPELGNLSNLKELVISMLDLTGGIPPELENLHSLEFLQLYRNTLSGPIPPELGNLYNLKKLEIWYNYHMSGSIPPELGNLRNLRRLYIYDSNLSGPIPKELVNLTNLYYLGLSQNQLTGPIPEELSNLTDLHYLDLDVNLLTGPIPPELGNLSNLSLLDLHDNQLTGPIPKELGNTRLSRLQLSDNNLTGQIPPELGKLGQLRYLDLSRNNLTGSVPTELASLSYLEELVLYDNAAMSGPLPLDLMRLSGLRLLGTIGTDLCAAPDGSFWSWVRQLEFANVARCAPSTKTGAYLTQAVQTLNQSVPLLSGEPALLRVFVTAGDGSGADFPPVRATFYHDGVPIHVENVPGRATALPAEFDEGSLSASINAEVPGWVIKPGLQMVIEMGPNGGDDSAVGSDYRLPETGAMPVEVIDLPPFNLTVVPIVNVDHPDRSILDKTAGLTEDDDLFRMTQDLLPVSEFSLKVRDFVWTSSPIFNLPYAEETNTKAILREIGLLQTADGSDDYYLGAVEGGGLARRGSRLVVAELREYIIAHELGHAMSLRHAPCGYPVDSDPHYPYADGTIGAWGYNHRTELLVSPETFDLMSYCGPQWISDYNFTRAIRYRKKTETTDVPIGSAASALLLWGGVDENGALVLEPAFVADDAASTPPERGPYRLTGTDNRERVLFTVDFGMDEFAHGGGGAFAFALPARSSWAGRLARITLTGPEGRVSMGAAGERSAALLLDRVTGQVRGLLRDLPTTSEIQDGIAARVLPPEPGLEIVISRGVPKKASW